MHRNLIFLALVLGTSLVVPSTLGVPAYRSYDGMGTIVTSFNLPLGQITAVDNGAVLCADADNDGYHESGKGGVCIPFNELAGDSVLVVDDDPSIGTSVVFQVCVDVDGDGVCAGNGGQSAAPCADVIAFSHSSATGQNFNPLYVDPAGALAQWQACGGVGYPGFVVITCGGVHDNKYMTNAHKHTATTGLVAPVKTGGTGHGDYCGALTAAKAFVVA